jgi:hypothetical protein
MPAYVSEGHPHFFLFIEQANGNDEKLQPRCSGLLILAKLSSKLGPL